MSSDNIQGSGRKNTNGAVGGGFSPKYADDGSLSHADMDYNLDLIGEVIKGYHVIGGSSTAGNGEFGGVVDNNDVGKMLRLHVVNSTPADQYLLNAGAVVGEKVWIFESF